MLSRRAALLGLAATLPAAALIRPAAAATPPWYSEGGIAIDGSDAVAYFDGNGPVAGRRDIAVEWGGTTWLFANAANREKFEMNPDSYAPQYGGYCAYAVSKGYTATTDPKAWTLHDGKLYLNYSRTVRALWARDIPGNVEKGNANWPGVLSA